MASTSSSIASSDLEGDESLPWATLELHLQQWLSAMKTAIAGREPQKVLHLLEGLVTFVASNEASFLRTIMAHENLEERLQEKGAPASFTSTFMDVIQIVGSVHGPRVLYFGASSALNARIAADLLAEFQIAAEQGSGSPRNSGRLSPRRANVLQHRTTQDMLDELDRIPAARPILEGALEQINSLQLSRMSNAIVTGVDKLPVAVIDGLEEASAFPFLIFRWLRNCLIEVFFCVYHAQTTFILKRKVIYVGPKPGSQIEGRLTLGAPDEHLLIEGPFSLPWTEVAGLLEAP